MKKNRNIIIVTHKYVTHPDDQLVIYLNEKKYENVLHICHSFNDAPDRKSYYVWYKNGEIYKKVQSFDYKSFPEPLILGKEIIYTLYWVIQARLKHATYIGMDGLCVLSGNFLKSLGIISKTIFWAIDFVPKGRFAHRYQNAMYHFINMNGYRNSDEMWDLSPRMAEAREKFLGIKPTEYKKRMVVQYGMWVERIKTYSYDTCEKNTLVFMGHLKENQGVQLVLNAIPQLIKKNPTFRFKIIGSGRYQAQLEKQASLLKIRKYCDFLGKISDHAEVEKEIAKSCLAIAPYMKELDKWTYYADPGKVKTYLACGVPVLLTDLPWNTKEIVSHKCGQVIEENTKDIVKHILELMKSNYNNEYRKNAVQYAKNFNYNKIFTNLEL